MIVETGGKASQSRTAPPLGSNLQATLVCQSDHDSHENQNVRNHIHVCFLHGVIVFSSTTALYIGRSVPRCFSLSPSFRWLLVIFLGARNLARLHCYD